METVLLPIAGDNPAGTSLRYDNVYDQIKEDRREDDPSLDQGIWKTKLKRADWKAVEKSCLDSLQSRSKDLQLAAWLMEAWCQMNGLAGVNRGVELIHELCVRFWDDLYPQIEEDSYEYRVAPIRWINEKLTVRIGQIPVTQPDNIDLKPYSFADWERVSRLENLSKQDSGVKLDEEDATTAKIYLSASLTPKEVFIEHLRTLRSIEARTRELGTFLDEKCGDESPSLVLFKKKISEIDRFVREVARDQLGEDPMMMDEEPVEEDTEQPGEEVSDVPAFEPVKEEAPKPAPSAPNSQATSIIQNRAEAYRRLEEAADFLMLTEPHSPAPYLVKRAIAWGNMTLEELLKELIEDPNYLGYVMQLLGLENRNE